MRLTVLAKDRFVRRVFHEIRTPLHVISASLQAGIGTGTGTAGSQGHDHEEGRDDEFYELSQQVRYMHFRYLFILVLY
jgi:signal transduction histidine kinase